MQTLELECPSCGEMLELDAGFAGGVCRCSNCGTLMTVPSDAGKAERLSRPSAGPSRGEELIRDLPRPGGASESPRAPRPSKNKASSGKGKKSRPSSASATIEPGEYRTASGKVVRLDASARVPMAGRKKKQIRAATTAIFFAVVLGIVALAVVAIIAMVGGPGKGGEGEGVEHEAVTPTGPVYDPNANPYKLEFANAAGVPVSGKVAVVIETSNDSSRWLADAADLLVAGLSKGDGSVSVAVFAGTSKGGNAYQDSELTPAKDLDKQALTSWLTQQPTGLTSDVTDAIQQALKQSPDVLVLVVSNAYDEQVDAWTRLVEGKETLVIHGLMINGNSRQLRNWLRDRKASEALAISTQDIADWREPAAE